MKITQSQIRKIIQEEIGKVNEDREWDVRDQDNLASSALESARYEARESVEQAEPFMIDLMGFGSIQVPTIGKFAGREDAIEMLAKTYYNYTKNFEHEIQPPEGQEVLDNLFLYFDLGEE